MRALGRRPRFPAPLAALLAICVIAGTGVSGRQDPRQEPKPQPEPQQPIPVFRAGTALVRVDVTATVRGDEPVTDLTSDDFEVTEDDVPQIVQTSQFVRQLQLFIGLKFCDNVRSFALDFGQCFLGEP